MSLYNEQVLEIYEDTSNVGELKNKTHSAQHVNPVCDDKITIELEIKNGKIINAKYRGKTCFISRVSANALTEFIKGKSLEEIKNINKEKMDEIIGTKIIETRIACELLPLEALKKILHA